MKLLPDQVMELGEWLGRWTSLTCTHQTVSPAPLRLSSHPSLEQLLGGTCCWASSPQGLSPRDRGKRHREGKNTGKYFKHLQWQN